MKTIKVQPLSKEAFYKYGSYAAFIDPMNEPATGPKDAPCVFFRDMLPVDMAGAAPCFSTCRVLPRPMVVTDAEFHDNTCEVAMPLDGDAVIWCAPAGAGEELPLDEVEAFLVPKGTAVMLRPGVWHHAAFPAADAPLNVLIVLPERTYVNDLFCTALDEQFAIEL